MELEPLAAMLGVKIKESDDLHPGIDGIYLHQHRAIVIRRGLDPWVERSVLAHELGHTYYGDEDLNDPRLERRADLWAAKLLISPAQYAAAERLHGPHLGAIAWELGVTVDLVEAWRSAHEKAAISQ